MTARLPTVLVLGDQLNRPNGALRGRSPAACRVLFVESTAALTRRRWHRQRAHLVVSSMRHFAAELTEAGYEVDYRRAPTLAEGVAAHRSDYPVALITATTPNSHRAVEHLEALGVQLLRNRLFLTTPDEFETWAGERNSLRMEDFYRWQRQRLDILMDGDQPAGGRWNFDADNREPPPKDGRSWPAAEVFSLDDIDRQVIADLEANPAIKLWGAEPQGWWPVTRHQAQQRLDDFIRHALPVFGAHEDAMLRSEWKLAHSALSSSMNLGLLHPSEVAYAAERAYRERDLPLNSVEGFVRQIIGWREYVWGVYWLWGPEYLECNELDAHAPIPPAFTGEAPTDMACVAHTIEGLHDRAYTHHIERLMVLGNLALSIGVDPQAMTGWMGASFIDGADWVMAPNVVGMALHADGGRMATKPYASGGAYINKMSDHCRSCRFNPKKRTGDDACPFTSLYWEFLARNEDRLRTNHRMSTQLGGMRRLADLDATRSRAQEVSRLLQHGQL
ncbi:MAG: cryptochrome/photolyase family protein [Actinomycetota bacterium]